MGRARRDWIGGAAYHVFSRGSNRQAIFLNDGDYVEFDLLLQQTFDKFELDFFAASLMPNHWHALVRSPDDGLSGFVQRLNHRYALRFNRRWNRSAHVFENRFGAVLQQSEPQFLWTLRYIVRNPVDAGMSGSVFDAPWTSFLATAGLATAPKHLCVDEILELFGGSRDAARRSYIEFVA